MVPRRLTWRISCARSSDGSWVLSVLQRFRVGFCVVVVGCMENGSVLIPSKAGRAAMLPHNASLNARRLTVRGPRELMAAVCNLSGNADLYGAGLRNGVYLQWISSQIAVFLQLDESAGLFESYLIFSIAIVVALLVSTSSHELHTTEVVIMLSCCLAAWCGWATIRATRLRHCEAFGIVLCLVCSGLS